MSTQCTLSTHFLRCVHLAAASAKDLGGDRDRSFPLPHRPHQSPHQSRSIIPARLHHLKTPPIAQPTGSQRGNFAAHPNPRGHVAIAGDISDCHIRDDVWCVEGRDSDKHPTVHKAVPTTKNPQPKWHWRGGGELLKPRVPRSLAHQGDMTAFHATASSLSLPHPPRHSSRDDALKSQL